MAVTPDGSRALSGSDDGTVVWWDIDWDYEFPTVDLRLARRQPAFGSLSLRQ